MRNKFFGNRDRTQLMVQSKAQAAAVIACARVFGVSV